MIVPYYDEDNHGLMPIAHIVLKDEYKDGDLKTITEDIINTQMVGNPEISSWQIPTRVKYRYEMPKTVNNKRDFNVLIAEGIDGSEVSVNVEETNLAIESIEIVVPNKSKVKSNK